MFALPVSTHPSIGRLTLRLSGFVRGRLWLQVLVAMFAGIATGMAIGPTGGWLSPAMAQLASNWLAIPGYLFLSMVQMIVIPLVVASIILGMTSSRDMAQLRSMGVRTGLFFLFTTVVAALIGVLVALAVEPGAYLQVAQMPVAVTTAGADAAGAAPSLSSLPAQIVRVVPTNPLQASVEQNMLQVVVFAIFVGVALVTMDGKLARPLVDLLGAVQEVSMVVVRWAMYLVPAAVFGLMTQLTARMGLDALLGMGVYVLTVLGALLLAFAFLMLVYALGRRRSPLDFLKGSRDVLLLAFSTSSSAAVMPLTIRTAEESLGVRKGVSRFVIPLGTTINMAGTALYQVIATLFLAQVYQVDVGLSGLLLVVVLAVGASIGSPGTPGIGIVILAMMLGTVGIPAEGIALIIGVDRVLDMSRTTLNVAGDLVAASVIDQVTAAAQPTADADSGAVS
ncbi:dicarboxylate/amino acid:cation symporter [Comamonadaceae bacterium G21597-S1]|nr:dicarboxylate/amino acid:cation symporter [Comamonadaceae bacterium G21597-S1]